MNQASASMPNHGQSGGHPGISGLLEGVAARVREAGVFGPVRIDGESLRCEALASAEPAELAPTDVVSSPAEPAATDDASSPAEPAPTEGDGQEGRPTVDPSGEDAADPTADEAPTSPAADDASVSDLEDTGVIPAVVDGQEAAAGR